MIFHEIYSLYYRSVEHILNEAFQQEITVDKMKQIIQQYAFQESVLTILPSLQQQKYQLMINNQSILKHCVDIPMSELEKRWLKAVLLDPRIQLFDISYPELEDIEPLFTKDDYIFYDQYSDGDDYNHPRYIKHFRMILKAMKKQQMIQIVMKNKNGNLFKTSFIPLRYEYSLKDDKIRIVTKGSRYSYFNLNKILACEVCIPQNKKMVEIKPKMKELILEVKDERNALERVMMQFAHFEKSTKRISDTIYHLYMKYDESDETEILIRILSFGIHVKVLGPQSLIVAIKERLKRQIDYNY